jgi:hypothetical protein
MGLGLQTGGAGGDIKPFIKFDARAGRMFRVDRTQTAGGQWESNEADISRDFTAIFDLANIKVGWVNFTPQGPIQRMVVLGKEPMPPRPNDVNAEGKPAFKQGFEFDLMLSKGNGGGPVRKLGSSAGCVIEAIDALHDEYNSAAEAKDGKLPIVRLADTKAVKAGQSTNYKPIFQITGWVDRPAEMTGAPVTAKPTATASPPSTGSTQTPPPQARPAPQPAAAMDASDFG